MLPVLSGRQTKPALEGAPKTRVVVIIQERSDRFMLPSAFTHIVPTTNQKLVYTLNNRSMKVWKSELVQTLIDSN